MSKMILKLTNSLKIFFIVVLLKNL